MKKKMPSNASQRDGREAPHPPAWREQETRACESWPRPRASHNAHMLLLAGWDSYLGQLPKLSVHHPLRQQLHRNEGYQHPETHPRQQLHNWQGWERLQIPTHQLQDGASVSQITTRQGKRMSSRQARHCSGVRSVGAYGCLAAAMECSAVGGYDNRNTLSHKAGAPHRGSGKAGFW